MFVYSLSMSRCKLGVPMKIALAYSSECHATTNVLPAFAKWSNACSAIGILSWNKSSTCSVSYVEDEEDC